MWASTFHCPLPHFSGLCARPLAVRVVPRGGCRWGAALALWRPTSTPPREDLELPSLTACAIIAPGVTNRQRLRKWLKALKIQVSMLDGFNIHTGILFIHLLSLCIIYFVKK